MSADPIDFQARQRAPEGTRYRQTEGGNADRLHDMWGRDFRYCPELGEYAFLVWDGKRWKRDQITMHALAAKTIRAIFHEASKLAVEAAKCEDATRRDMLSEEAEQLLKWARKSDTDHMVKAMLSLVRPKCAAHFDELDQHPMLLNCPNGTLDLHTGKLRTHRREDYLTQITSTPYEPGAKAPNWERMISEAMLGRDELVTFLQQYLGSALTGDVNEHAWNMSVGGGRNGKSTTYEAFAAVLGDYGLVMSPESIVAASHGRGGSQASPDLAELIGKRLVILTETEEGDRLAAALVKRLTGGDTMKARRLFENMLTFAPTWKLVLYTNYKPRVRDNSDGFWDRMRLVPFDNRIHPSQTDHDLPKKLQAEAAGILAWAVRGCLAWKKTGRLPYPAIMQRAALAYRSEQDIITLFINEACCKEDGASVGVQALYNAYVEWVKTEANEMPMARRTFKALMEQHSYKARRTMYGNMWQGLRMRTPDDPEPGGPSDESETPSMERGPVGESTPAPAPAGTSTAEYTGEPWYNPARPDDTPTQAMEWACEGDVMRALGWTLSPKLRECFATGGTIITTKNEGAITPAHFPAFVRELYRQGKLRSLEHIAKTLGADVPRVLGLARQGVQA